MIHSAKAFDEPGRVLRDQPENPQVALFAGTRLAASGRIEEAVAIWSLGDEAGSGLFRIAGNEQAHPAMRADARYADELMRDFLTGLHQKALDEFAESATADLGRVRTAIWPATHNRPFDFKEPLQRPIELYIPGLPAVRELPRDLLPWRETVEQAFPDIRADYLGALHHSVTFVPLLDGQNRYSVGSSNWSAIHLVKQAHHTAQADLFGMTLTTVERAGLVRVGGVPRNILVARIVPGTHIAARHGATNSRLTVHLSIFVPENCAIRVGKENHIWREGEIFCFDDSYEHEIWNGSGSDLVWLQFETHHPDLSAEERAAIEHCSSVRRTWFENRPKLLGID